MLKDKSGQRVFYRKSDIVLLGTIFLLLSVSLLLFFRPNKQDSKLFAEVYFDGEKVMTLALSEEQVGLHALAAQPQVVLEVTPDLAVRFASSSCPDQVCVRAGRLSQAGQFAACLPNRVHVQIVSAEPAAVPADFVIGLKQDSAAGTADTSLPAEQESGKRTDGHDSAHHTEDP